MSRRPSSAYRPSVSRPGSSGLRFGMFAVCVTRDSDPELNKGKAKPLYDLLVSYADVSSRDTGQGYPYREALASCLDCSKQTVDRATDYLEKVIGIVTVHPRKVEGRPEENDANLYELHDAWLIHGMTPPKGTPPQLVARYGHTVPGLDVDAWVAEHAPDFDLAAWRKKYEAMLRKQEAGREEQRRKERARKERARRKPKKGGDVTHDATPQEGPEGGGSVMGDVTGGVTHDVTGGVMGDALVYSPVVESRDQEPTSPSVRPSVQVVDADAKTTDGGTDGGGGDIEDQEHGPAGAGEGPAAADAAPENSGSNEGGGARSGRPSAVRPVDLTPGVEVLRAVAAEAPEWTIRHAASLQDQGRTVTGMLETGFTPQEIRAAILSRELPQPLRTTVAGVISGRLRDLIAVGPSAGVQPIPAQQTGGTYDLFRREADGQDDGPTPTPASWREKRAQLEAEVAGHGRLRPCTGDEGLCPHNALPDGDLCSYCLGGERPTCANGCGRSVVAPGCMCITCAAPPAIVEMGDCPGYGGQPCGRAVVTEGLCARHKIEAERDRAAAEAEWEAARDAAIAAAQAAEPAPF